MTSGTIKGVATRSLHRSPTTATLRKCLALGHAWTCSDVCTGGNQAVIPHSPLNGRRGGDVQERLNPLGSGAWRAV